MKVRITYDPESRAERVAAHLISTEAQKVMRMLPNTVRVKESDAHPPMHHVYIGTRAPKEAE